VIEFIGNESSLVVHSLECEWALQIHPLNVVTFVELFDALGAGYRECGACIPSDHILRLRRGNEVLREVREIRIGDGCVICCEHRGIQLAHIVPAAAGGTTRIPLCPRCHWNYDHGLLTEYEFSQLAKVARPERRELDIGTLRRFHGAVARMQAGRPL
jgi:hypothetical protein